MIRVEGEGEGEGDGHEGLEGVAELVGGLLGELVERVPEPGLADELERGAAHPQHYVHFRGPVAHALFDGLLELYHTKEDRELR